MKAPSARGVREFGSISGPCSAPSNWLTEEDVGSLSEGLWRQGGCDAPRLPPPEHVPGGTRTPRRRDKRFRRHGTPGIDRYVSGTHQTPGPGAPRRPPPSDGGDRVGSPPHRPYAHRWGTLEDRNRSEHSSIDGRRGQPASPPASQLSALGFRARMPPLPALPLTRSSCPVCARVQPVLAPRAWQDSRRVESPNDVPPETSLG